MVGKGNILILAKYVIVDLIQVERTTLIEYKPANLKRVNAIDKFSLTFYAILVETREPIQPMTLDKPINFSFLEVNKTG